MCILFVRWSVYTRTYTVSFHLCKQGDIPNYAKPSEVLQSILIPQVFYNLHVIFENRYQGIFRKLFFKFSNQFIVVHVVSTEIFFFPQKYQNFNL